MKNLFLAGLALFTAFGHAQKLDNALLWKISGNGLSKPSYLFGTMHITCDATLDTNVLNALDATTQLYLELDMDDPNLQMEMMKGMIMKDGKKMSTLASPEDFKAVDGLLLKNVGVSAKMLDNYIPAMVEMMLMPKMLDCPMQSVEAELMKRTKEQKEEVYGLEKIADQFDAFNAIPYEDQMKKLVKIAKDNMASSNEEFLIMDKIYQSKDLNALMEYMNAEENAMYGDNADVLLDKRNISWIPVIEDAVKKTPTFFGVGAAHLAGENGVIKLLRKRGYKVEAVK